MKDIHTLIGVEKTSEIISKRGEYHKVFDVGDGKKRMLSFTSPIHYLNNESKTYEEIGTELIYNRDKDCYLALKNKFSTGFRNDGLIYKYVGIRHGENHQFEMTLIDLTLDGESIKLPELCSLINNNNEIEIFLQEDISILARLNNLGLRTAIKVNKWIKSFKMIEEFHLLGFSITNESKIVDGIEEYIPNEFNEFILRSDNEEDFKIYIKRPKMWNEDSSNIGIDHKLYKKDDKFYYEKIINKSGKDWLILNHPIFYIDGTAFYSTTDDGYVEKIVTQSGHLWSECQGASEGTSASQDDSSYTGITADHNKSNFVCDRSFYWFNTSDIGIGSTITDASFKIYVTAVSNNTQICVMKGTMPSTILGTSNYIAFDGSYYGKVAVSTSDLNKFYVITLDSTGINDIVKNGTTKICAREYDHDYLNVAPASTTYTTTVNYADNITNIPFLDITYIEGSTVISLKVYYDIKSYGSLSSDMYMDTTLIDSLENYVSVESY